MGNLAFFTGAGRIVMVCPDAGRHHSQARAHAYTPA